jgi:hypothetical protein
MKTLYIKIIYKFFYPIVLHQYFIFLQEYELTQKSRMDLKKLLNKLDFFKKNMESAVDACNCDH